MSERHYITKILYSRSPARDFFPTGKALYLFHHGKVASSPSPWEDLVKETGRHRGLEAMRPWTLNRHYSNKIVSGREYVTEIRNRNESLHR